jgi:hypothetical protein
MTIHDDPYEREGKHLFSPGVALLSAASVLPEIRIVSPTPKVYVVSWFEKNYELGLHDESGVSAVFLDKGNAEQHIAGHPESEKIWDIEEFEIADYPPPQEQHVKNVTAAP